MNSLGLSGLLSLFGLVTFGSLIPIVPTGPILSAGAALAHGGHAWELPIVIVLAALGAYLGDLGSFWFMRGAGETLGKKIGFIGRFLDKVKAKQGSGEGSKSNEMAQKMADNAPKALVIGRLLPGGRLPSLLAAAMIDLPMQKFLRANVPAVVVWALVYAAIGFLGSSIIPNPTVAVIVVVLIGLVFSKVLEWVQGRVAKRSSGTAA